ncbi:MAG: saccharopine dehydrogenase NADP-binding domain-containing protein [Acidobacteriota bacterium]|nr:MAG: saccharopine dehydrogenase NADP-binding domain-containing protein [Acidobacteriota bacterium]
MQGRDYDVVLYGASGFTGRQTVEYFAAHTAPGEVRWAVAGRNREKLEEVKARIGERVGDIDVLVADSGDQAAVDAIVSRTRVLLTTAGPYAKYGTPIVDACVRFKTHYVDITGETTWVRDLIDRYHEKAAAEGTRIIPFCGFDSVPSDLGAFLVARHIREKFGAGCREVRAYHRVYGGVNGGTIATVFNMYESGQNDRVRDVFLLDPQNGHSREEIARNQDPTLPHYDDEIGSWVGPFFMGPINTRVVRRSAALFDKWHESYGAGFRYQEYMKHSGPLGGAQALAFVAGGGLFELAIRSPFRPWIKAMMPAPGSGPSEKTMNEGWFKCELLGIAEDGRQVKGMIRDQGDPGNRATVKFLCESALALNTAELPGGPGRGGILTPATGLGAVLAERLRRAGMTIEVG